MPYWGSPMPEVVRDYTIAALPVGGTNSWQTILTVEENHQRKRVHMVSERWYVLIMITSLS